MSVIDAREQARGCLVLALKMRRREVDNVQPKPASGQDSAPQESRAPLVTPDIPTLDSALDEPLTQFSKTLSYLEK
jgi:hypothetical protein